jgi:MinD-like ATPase involved in chromosome partitioning or flagellar assembly
MSLVNVAASLAQAGRTVLIVDFDLEAPGICEFDLEKPEAPQQGIVEFVTDYTSSGEVPDVRSYIYESNKFDDTGGKILVMPAGRQDGSYQQRFSSINWQQLYEHCDGFMLMEDLRLQWEKTLNCDYVLIDSRTGYTDIGGICTRQLPDSVCLVFAPNKQNLSGLVHVTKEIRAQKGSPDLRNPYLHFVASNVPAMDDENQALAGALARFKDQLGYTESCSVIHHYSSFALLNEEIFTLKYPSTLLSTEYNNLAEKISSQNFSDRIYVLEFLKNVISNYPSAGKNYSASDIEDRLIKIVSKLGHDPNILYLVSRVKRISGDIEQSREILEMALQRGCKLPRAYLDHAVFHEREQNPQAVWEDIGKALNSPEKASSTDVVIAIRIALRLDPGILDLDAFSKFPAIKSLSEDELMYVASTVDDSRFGAELCIKLLTSLLKWEEVDDKVATDANIILGNAYIALGKLQKAIEIYSDLKAEDTTIQLLSSFNSGMAYFWLGKKDIAGELFKKCSRLFPLFTDDSPNRIQCEAFSIWVNGDAEKAISKLNEIDTSVIAANTRRLFSCWRYYSATSKQFSSDLDEMKQLFTGRDVKPKFLTI